MRRLLLLLAALFCLCGMTARAQVTYLVNSHAPAESRSCKVYRYNGPSSPEMALSGGQKWRGGFTIGHSVGPYVPGFATFRLGGRYDKLLFVLGHENTNTGAGGTGIDTEPCIFTVLADGRKILDRKIYPYGLPERVTLEVGGVDELKFQIVTGEANIGVAEATLWSKGQTPKQTGNLPKGEVRTIELVKDLRPYFQNVYMQSVSPADKIKSLKINGVEYDYGLNADMGMAIIGERPAWAYFNLQGQYEKLSFIAGPLDDAGGRHGKGWFTVKADGRIIWEYEMNYDDIARQVTLDVSGCRMLSFHSEQESSSTSGGIARIMAYPAGAQPQGEAEAPADPRLKALPDVCKLISNIPPYAAGAKVRQQIFDGASDYITFSMGGVRFSEGFMLYQTASFLDDNLSSYAVFDLGGEFDYVSFTAGYVGKSQAMNDDLLRVYADDELVLEAPLRATWPNQDYVVPIRKCRRLRFENKGSGRLDVAAFGVADLVVYRGEPVANTLFEHPRPDCPDETDLLDLGAPYIHYVSPMKDRTIYYDGSTQKNYFMVGDRRVNKGFLLQTSVHFSLDFGPLAEGSDNAAAAAVGSAAVGASFVAGTTAVGGAVVGSTLAGVAAFLALAAGGEAVENSCAAFNTYGEYNSVTFTVACVRPNNASRPSDYNETLLIGADQRVVAELIVSETMEPQTVTVPIDGCRQLMFWLANTYNWSGQYAFYDIRLSKSRAELDIPRAARRSEAVVSQPLWSGYALEHKWERPRSSGAKSLDEFLVKLSNAYSGLEGMMERKPLYEIHTYYLETAAGEVCKAVRLRDPRSGSSFRALSLVSEYRGVAGDLERLLKLRQEFNELNVMKASAALDLPTLGFGAIAYGKIYKFANKTLAECRQLLDRMIEEQRANAAFLQAVLDTAVDIDGKRSTEQTVFCPLFAGETAPGGYLQAVERFNAE